MQGCGCCSSVELQARSTYCLGLPWPGLHPLCAQTMPIRSITLQCLLCFNSCLPTWLHLGLSVPSLVGPKGTPEGPRRLRVTGRGVSRGSGTGVDQMTKPSLGTGRLWGSAGRSNRPGPNSQGGRNQGIPVSQPRSSAAGTREVAFLRTSAKTQLASHGQPLSPSVGDCQNCRLSGAGNFVSVSASQEVERLLSGYPGVWH